MSYAQGMAMLRLASAEYGYDIDPGRVASIWRAGCIIRAALLTDVRAAFAREREPRQPADGSGGSRSGGARQDGLRRVVQTAAALGIPVPAMSASLAYYDCYRSARLPANLTQAQRDFFGAHTYRRIDRDGVFHTDVGRRQAVMSVGLTIPPPGGLDFWRLARSCTGSTRACSRFTKPTPARFT